MSLWRPVHHWELEEGRPEGIEMLYPFSYWWSRSAWHGKLLVKPRTPSQRKQWEENGQKNLLLSCPEERRTDVYNTWPHIQKQIPSSLSFTIINCPTFPIQLCARWALCSSEPCASEAPLFIWILRATTAPQWAVKKLVLFFSLGSTYIRHNYVKKRLVIKYGFKNIFNSKTVLAISKV